MLEAITLEKKTSSRLDRPDTYCDGSRMPYPWWRWGQAPAAQSWQVVGAWAFDGARVWYTSLGNGFHRNPYVAFEDGANSQKATVMKYSGGSWVVVGTAGFSAGVVQLTSLAIDSTRHSLRRLSGRGKWQQSHGNEILRWLLGGSGHRGLQHG